MKNFIFFDIDGTIISEDGYLPESAVRAIRAARKKATPPSSTPDALP